MLVVFVETKVKKGEKSPVDPGIARQNGAISPFSPNLKKFRFISRKDKLKAGCA